MRGIAFADRLRRRTARPEGAHRTVPAVKTGERPYSDLPGEQVAAYRAAAASEDAGRPQPTFTRHAPGPADTAPMAKLRQGPPPMPHRIPGSVAVPKVVANPKLLRWVLDALMAWDGLADPERTSAPLGDEVRRTLRLGDWPPSRRGEAAQRRAQSLAYPSYYRAEVAGHSAYDTVMRHADRITGTQGSGQFRPALPAGDTR